VEGEEEDLMVILDTFELAGVEAGVTVKFVEEFGVPELGVELTECWWITVAPTFFEDVDDVRFRLAGFEGAAVEFEVVCFGLLLILALLLVDVAGEGEGADLNFGAASTDCDLACNLPASFPSGMVEAVGVGSLWLLR
jgi:hypothetical protein